MIVCLNKPYFRNQLDEISIIYVEEFLIMSLPLKFGSILASNKGSLFIFLATVTILYGV